MRTAPALLIVLALTAALTGCVPDDDPIVLDPEPSVSPIFESDEEALAAAEEAYGAYLAVSNEVLSAGGADPGPALELIAPSYRTEATEGFDLYVERQWRSEGDSTFDSAELQQYADYGDGTAMVTVYLCLDVSKSRIIDATGADVTPITRQDRLPLVVEFENAAEFSTDLLQTGSEVWSGDNFCV